jgi:hypothetical protein
MNDWQAQFSSITTTGRTSPVRPNLPVRYSSWGNSTEAERYANLPAEFNVAVSNHDAATWLDMMRKNPHGALDRCTDAPQASGRPARSSYGLNRHMVATVPVTPPRPRR